MTVVHSFSFVFYNYERALLVGEMNRDLWEDEMYRGDSSQWHAVDQMSIERFWCRRVRIEVCS